MEIPPELIEKFDNNFWQGHSIMYNNFLKNKKYISQFFHAFSLLSSIHDTYAKSLMQVCTCFQKPEGKDLSSPFYKAILSFIDQLKEESNYHLSLAEKAKDIVEKQLAANLIHIGQIFGGKKEQALTINENEESELLLVQKLKDFKQIENLCKESLSDCDKYKKEYYDEITNTLKENLKKKDFINGVFDEDDNKDSKIIEIFNKKDAYITQIDKANHYIEEYKTQFSTHAKAYQLIDAKYMALIKESMLSYSESKKKYIDSSVLSLQSKLIDVLTKLELNEIQKSFIEENRTYGFPPSQLVFINYSLNSKKLTCDIDLTKDNYESRNYLDAIHRFINKFIVDQKKKNDEIATLFNSLMKGEMTEEQFELMKNKLKDNENGHENILQFLSLLNNSRAKSCLFSEKYFNYLIDFINIISEITQKDETEFTMKYKCLNWIIILSQTFYTQKDNDPNKIYLLENMISKGIFDNVNWFNLFRYIYHENVKASSNLTDYKFEFTEQDLDQIKGVLQPKLAGIIQNMVMVKQPEEVIDKVIEILSKFYKEDKESLLSIKKEFMKIKD